MILQDSPADFERHEWGFSIIMRSAAWDVQWDAGAWGRGTGRARQAFFSLTNE